MGGRVKEDKVIRGICLYKADWEYLRLLSRAIGQPTGYMLREMIHELVTSFRELASEEVLSGKESPNVRAFLKRALVAVTEGFAALTKLLEEGEKRDVEENGLCPKSVQVSGN